MEAPIPIDSNGNFSLVPSYKAVSGETIRTEQHNPPLEDIASALSQVVYRSGVAPMMGSLNMNGFTLANLGESTAPAAPATNQQLLSAVSDLQDMVAAACPPGTVASFRRKTAPAGWVIENGGTIGSAASGATARANDDTLALFTLFWSTFTNAELPITTSTGAASTRGASAAADFAANKRLQIHDSRTRFLRGSDSGLGFDGTLVPGLNQADAIKAHTHAGTTNSGGSHTHQFGTSDGAGSNPNEPLRGNGLGGSLPGTTLSGGAHVHTFTTDATGIALETRSRGSVVLLCVKL